MSNRDSKNERPVQRGRGRPSSLTLVVEGNVELPMQLQPHEVELLTPYLSVLLADESDSNPEGGRDERHA